MVHFANAFNVPSKQQSWCFLSYERVEQQDLTSRESLQARSGLNAFPEWHVILPPRVNDFLWPKLHPHSLDQFSTEFLVEIKRQHFQRYPDLKSFIMVVLIKTTTTNVQTSWKTNYISRKEHNATCLLFSAIYAVIYCYIVKPTYNITFKGPAKFVKICGVDKRSWQ